MADFHVLSQDQLRKVATVVFHVPVPAGTNSAGVTWQQAVVDEQGGSDAIASVLSGISSAEITAMKAGSLLEREATVRFTSVNLTNGQRLAEIQAAFDELKASLVAEKQVTLDFFGYEGSGT